MLEDAVGIVGMLCLVSAFLLTLLGSLSSGTLTYKLLNLVGAGILAWYGVAKETYIFVALEGFWAAAALYSILRGERDTAAS